jgi:hypothetical protein
MRAPIGSSVRACVRPVKGTIRRSDSSVMRRWFDHGLALLTACAIAVAAFVALTIAIAVNPPWGPDHGERVAQGNLRNAANAATTLYTDSQTYLTATPHELTSVAPTLHFTAIDNADSNTIGAATTDQSILFVARDPHGTHMWFCILLTGLRNITYGTGTTLYSVASPDRCQQSTW